MRCPKCHHEVRELWEDPYHPDNPRVCEDCFDREAAAIEVILLILAAVMAVMAVCSWVG